MVRPCKEETKALRAENARLKKQVDEQANSSEEDLRAEILRLEEQLKQHAARSQDDWRAAKREAADHADKS